MENEGLVVCCSHTALMLAKDDPEIVASCVMTNIVPESEVYVIDKEMFVNWLKQNGIRGDRVDNGN